jgi:ATP-binding cassette, subfamily B, bacterial MsbA
MSRKLHNTTQPGGALGADRPKPRTLRKLLAYALGVWRVLVALGFCIVATSLLDLATPWVIGFLLLDRVIKRSEAGQLPAVVLLLSGIFLGQRVLEFAKDYLQELANQRIVNQLRCDLYSHIVALPVRFFDRGRTGELLARLTGDIDTVEGFLETLMQNVGSELVMLVGTLSFLFAISPRLTLYLLPTVATLAVSVFFFKKTVKKYARRLRNLIGEMSSLAEEAIAGVRMLKAFCAERFEFGRFAIKSSQLLQGRVSMAKLSALYSSTVELSVFAGTLIVVVVATPWVLAGSFTVGALVAYIGYLNKLYGPVKKLSKINLSIQKILAAGDRVFEVMEVAPETGIEPWRQLPGGDKLSARLVWVQSSGAVEFENVSFSYDSERPVLKNFTLRVQPGEVLALVGPSGAGKTTIVNLLLRFYEPASGRILIDGIPLDQIPIGQLRQQIGLVSQETFLFSGTARHNIAYAYPNATDQQIMDAARSANADQFLAQSAEGYLLQVGERGVQLSGGQRQRIAIARALLRNPKIMIFDEATSHLDSQSEHLIQEALEKVTYGRTVIVVAHRLSTIRRADKIVVLDGGGIAEIGKHEDLLTREGIYRKLHSLQGSAGEHEAVEWLKNRARKQSQQASGSTIEDERRGVAGDVR